MHDFENEGIRMITPEELKKLACQWCDGTGIICLDGGPSLSKIKAPCIECSANRKLEDLERELDHKIMLEDRFQERLAIREHNKRIAGL